MTDTLRSPKTGDRLFLSTPFILENSEKIFVDGRPVERADYEINYQRGLLRINVPLLEESVVVVSYVRLPFLLNSVYSLRDVRFAEVPDPMRVPPVRPEADQPLPAPDAARNLVFGGTKSISFSVGSNKGATLDQTLRATIEGQLTPSIQVRAMLSDNNLPIQPEGNTEDLEYLDKVFVELTGPRAKAALGDLTFQSSASKFSAFKRELTGAMGEVDGGWAKVGVAGGSSKGIFRTKSFRGTEQLQGPYDLLSQGRIINEVIIAGTEKVYFDGELLQRGQNRDYTIDYDRGTITFTPRKLVTADTEIAVDFEVSQEEYDRNSLFAEVKSAAIPGGLGFQALVAREWDDADSPKAISLEDQDELILRDAGDDPGLAIAGGVVFAGAGKGEYRFVDADTVSGVPAHYEFDDSTGSYLLTFTELGVGKGDYVLDGITALGRPIYRFMGIKRGNYIVGKQLPLPRSHGLLTARLMRDRGEHFRMDFEYNVSDFDGNTRSPLDDESNVGDAGELNLQLKNIPVRVGEIELAGSVSTLQDRFKSFDKIRPWYFYRDWNLEQDVLKGREILQHFGSSFNRGESLKLDYSLGLLKRDNFDGTKHESRALLSRGIDRSFRARVFSTDLEGETQERTRRHGTFSLSYGLWKLIPTISYAKEEFLSSSPVLPDSGIAYDRYGVKIEKRHVRNVGFAVEAEERRTDQLADTTAGWVEARRERTFRSSVSSRGFPSIQGEIHLVHRIQDNFIFDDRRSSDLARLTGFVRLAKYGWRSDVDYEISQNQFRTQQKSVVFVGEGKGDYNELGEPVGKGRGDYMLVFLPTLETIPTHRVDFTIRTVWRSNRRGVRGTRGNTVVSWVKSNVALEQSFSVQEESTFDKAYQIYLMFPSALQREDATLRGLTSLRQEWSLLESYPNVSLVLRYVRDDEEENRFGGVKEDRFFQQHVVNFSRSLSERLSANVQLKRELRQRDGKGLPKGTGSTYDVEGLGVSGGWGVRLPGGSTLDGDVEFLTQEDSESMARERALSLKPRFVWRISNSINVFGRYEATKFWQQDETGVRPFFFSSGGTAHRWGLTPNIRISKTISVLSTYEGRSERTFSNRRVVEHNFRIETRAYF